MNIFLVGSLLWDQNYHNDIKNLMGIPASSRGEYCSLIRISTALRCIRAETWLLWEVKDGKG